MEKRGGAPTSADVLVPLFQKEGYRVKSASVNRNKILRLIEMLSCIYINRKTTDLVLIDTYSTQNFWYAVLCANFCHSFSLKYVPVLHGGNLPNRLKKNPKVFKRFLNRAWQIIFPSVYLKEQLESSGIKRGILIPNPITLKNYPFKCRKEVSPNLIWVRAFSEIYNPLLALKILEKLITYYPEASLVMIGPVKDRSFKVCKKYAVQRNLPVKFLGKLPKRKWIELSSNFNIFLNTTNIDNTPVSVLEAMALGLPVVSTNVGGLSYIIEHKKTGLLVKPGDVEESISAIDFLLKNPQRSQEISKKAREYVESFDWQNVKFRWAELFKQA